MYELLRTDTADELMGEIVFGIAERFGKDVAFEKLDELEEAISHLSGNPYLGRIPRYRVLARQGYRVLILEKDFVYYKVDEEKKTVTIYAVFDQRQSGKSILKIMRNIIM